MLQKKQTGSNEGHHGEKAHTKHLTQQDTQKTRSNDYLTCIVYSSILLILIIPPTNVKLQPWYGQ